MNDVVQQASSSQEVIHLTESATKHLLSCLKEAKDSSGVRFSLKKTGCSGLSYVVDYVSSPLENDVVMPLGDEYQLCIDKASFPYLKGMVVDYVKQGINQKFVFENPNQTGQCGCGESFTVEEIDL